MARIRTLKPEFWSDEKLGPLSPIDRLVFVGLISIADDCGRLVDNIKQIDAAIFPYTDDSARQSVATLEAIGRILRGKTRSGLSVIQILNWHHQKIERPNIGGALPPLDGYDDEQSAYTRRKRVPRWLRDMIFQRDASTCQSCGKTGLRKEKSGRYDSGPDLGEVDHRVEAADGGEPTPENLWLLCMPCNRKKGGEAKRIRNVERAKQDARCVGDTSPTHQRQIGELAETRSTTYDLRSTTFDQRSAISEPPTITNATVDPTDPWHARVLAAAANRAVTAKFGEQPTPYVASSGHTIAALQRFADAGVDIEFARERLADAVARLTLDRPPRSIGYFVPAIIEQWLAERAHRDATAIAPAVASARDPLHFAAVRYAREGDAEWRAYCAEKGIAWEVAA